MDLIRKVGFLWGMEFQTLVVYTQIIRLTAEFKGRCVQPYLLGAALLETPTRTFFLQTEQRIFYTGK